MYTFVFIVGQIETSVSCTGRQVILEDWPKSAQIDTTQQSVVIDAVDSELVGILRQQHEQFVIDRCHTDYVDVR